MYINNIWTTLLLVSCVASTSSDLQSIDDLAASSDYIYVADGSTLHLLHSNLTHLSSLTMGNVAISKIVVNTDETFIIVCLVDGLCKSFEIESLLDTSNSSSVNFNASAVMAAVPRVRKIALRVTSNSTFYVGFEGRTMEAGERAIVLQQFKYDESVINQLRIAEEIITNSNFISRDFYDVFKNEHFIYYVAVDAIGSRNRLTVMRVCDDTYNERFSAVVEVELDCETVAPIFNITHFSLVSDADQLSRSTMLVITTSSKIGSQVCGYWLADINAELQRAYNECISTDSISPLPWADYDDTENCSRLIKLETTECNFGSHSSIPALSARSSIPGSFLLTTVDEVTATLALSLDNFQFLYVAHTNASGHYLSQYYILMDMTVSLMKVETISSAVHHLKHNQEYIYAATDNEAFIVVLDDCSLYTDCKSCVEKKTVCGWCTLEGICSRKTNCSKSHLRNRWTKNSDSCISYVTLLQPHSAVTPLNANVTVMPTSATFPEIDLNEEYSCRFINSGHNYSFTLPFVDGKYCDASNTLVPSFGFKQIELQLQIVPLIGNKDFASFSTNNTFTIHNCSFSSRCRECAVMGVCGWCIYDNKCTGANTLCQTSADWRSLSVLGGSRSKCPILLTPKHGWYLQSVGDSNKLELYTRNLPLLIPGYKFMCELRDPFGLSIVASAINSTPINDCQVICQIEHNQITIPETSKTGVMALQLNLVLVNENRSFIHVIEWEKGIGDGNPYSDGDAMESPPTSDPSVNQTLFNMLVFNCSYFGHDCSSCIAATSGTSLPCVWCRGDDPNSGSCVQLSKCFKEVIISIEGAHQCPQPQITSVSPTSGHIDGGTEVTISGSNLGVSINDVSVHIGTTECTLLPAKYKPGKKIVCTTNRASSEGELTITVRIARAQTELVSTYNSFTYARPHVTLVHPRYGPVSGGTLVTISGTALDVGNTEMIRVKIVEEFCEIINISREKVMCKTSRKDNHGIGMIIIQYESARVNGESYSYTPNPIFTSIFPHNTIPAGGVALNFTGHNLNVTQNPRMIIYIGNTSYSNTCQTNKETLLHCTAPILPSLMQILEIIESQRQSRKREGRNDVKLNYTLILDSAPGPRINEAELLLTVKPNPIMIEVEEDSRTYISGSEDAITLIGKYLDTVDITEIRVLLGEYMCIELTLVTPMILKCKPDISILTLESTTQTKEIKVLISSTLEYNIGHIQIINNGTMDDDNTFSQIIVAVVAVIIITIALAIAFCTFIIAACMCLKKKSREFRLKQVPMERNYFDGIGDDDLYDHIQDTPKDIVSKERKLNNYLYNTNNEDSIHHTNNRQDNRSARGSLPQIPQDDYVDMQSHSVQHQKGLKGNTTMHQHQHASRTGSTGEYVAMLPASRPECKHFNEDYVDIEEMTNEHK